MTQIFFHGKTKVVVLAEISIMVHLDYSLDNGKLLGLLLAEMTLFRPCTYGTPSLGRDGPNAFFELFLG